MKRAKINQPGLHAAIKKAAARFARCVGTAAEPLVLFLPQENSCRDQNKQAENADDSHEEQTFRSHLSEQGGEVG